MATELELLMSRARYYVDEEFDGARIIDLFNECLEDLSEVVYYAKTKQYVMEANTGKIELPSDLTSVVQLKVDEEESREIPVRNPVHADRYGYPYTHKVFGKELEVTPKPIKPYTITLLYYGEIPYIDPEDYSLGTIVDLPKRFKRALPLYAAFRYYENWQEDTTMQQTYRNQYMEVKAEIARFYREQRNKVTSNRVVIEQEWF